jgi:hypothetical protein
MARNYPFFSGSGNGKGQGQGHKTHTETIGPFGNSDNGSLFAVKMKRGTNCQTAIKPMTYL